jgi:hypothetical protein
MSKIQSKDTATVETHNVPALEPSYNIHDVFVDNDRSTNVVVNRRSRLFCNVINCYPIEYARTTTVEGKDSIVCQIRVMLYRFIPPAQLFFKRENYELTRFNLQHDNEPWLLLPDDEINTKNTPTIE